ncbi:hypothetical protein PRK78_007235 [Emydomyces testavorans]|uniref:Nucleoside transporter n=1 Tax=Emydomyces testavorans TaxID=2070801 RepID=A0AAF0DMU6_9EURO|nr:hypothetical protein PRK78_007235 [Emydomyces testavorans]
MLRSHLQRLFNPPRSYERLGEEDREQDEIEACVTPEAPASAPFSWLEYGIFLWLGVSMLWAWNMFFAAAPYFQRRFDSDPWVRKNFQSSIISVSCITNLSSVFVLAKLQKNACYPRRIKTSILLNIIVFTLLALSTVLFRNVAIRIYFAFVLLMVFAASLVTGTNQNGVFAYVAGFGRDEYTQGIMIGQGVAGVLPCIVQMLAVLVIPDATETVNQETAEYQSAKSAFAYFTTATGVSAIAFFAFLYLNRMQRSRRIVLKHTNIPALVSDEDEAPVKKSIPLYVLFRKLHWTASAIFICFAVTMAFPVFTAEIHSVRESENTVPPPIFRAAAFIPLAFLFWNLGDLLGRMFAGIPALKKLTHRPFLLFMASVARILFIPLYLMCNVRGEGAKIKSDFFYLFIVQLLFGITNGYLCSVCMMGASDWVEEDEREASGAFMGLMLVAGLTSGSLLSFFIGKV